MAARKRFFVTLPVSDQIQCMRKGFEPCALQVRDPEWVAAHRTAHALGQKPFLQQQEQVCAQLGQQAQLQDAAAAAQKGVFWQDGMFILEGNGDGEKLQAASSSDDNSSSGSESSDSGSDSGSSMHEEMDGIQALGSDGEDGSWCRGDGGEATGSDDGSSSWDQGSDSAAGGTSTSTSSSGSEDLGSKQRLLRCRVGRSPQLQQAGVPAQGTDGTQRPAMAAPVCGFDHKRFLQGLALESSGKQGLTLRQWHLLCKPLRFAAAVPANDRGAVAAAGDHSTPSVVHAVRRCIGELTVSPQYREASRSGAGAGEPLKLQGRAVWAYVRGVLLDYLPATECTEANVEAVLAYLKVQLGVLPRRPPKLSAICQAARTVLSGKTQWPDWGDILGT